MFYHGILSHSFHYFTFTAFSTLVKLWIWKEKKTFSIGERLGFPFGKRHLERRIISYKNNSQINVRQAREAMGKFKMQAVNEVGVNLQSGYNASLTFREAGNLGIR